MKVSFFQYQNGLNNGDVINGCGLFLSINFCNFVWRQLLIMIPAKYYKDIKLQSGAAFSDYKVGQSNYKVGQVLQSGAKKSQSGAGITKWGITYPFLFFLPNHYLFY